MTKNNSFEIPTPRGILVLGKGRTRIMGIVNVTPDSFSDGGKFFSLKDAVDHGLRLWEEGADILDIGGESTRPYADKVSLEEEKKRVLPVIEKLAAKVDIHISIDTNKAKVAEESIHAGASVINDVSALRFDPDMAEVAARTGVPVILMHMKGTPQDMQVAPAYENVVKEIKEFLQNQIHLGMENGISKSQFLVDPGIGFGKTVSHNLEILNNLGSFADLGCPVVFGSSRKFFIRKILENEYKKEISPFMPEVESGTQATIAAAVLQGAHIVRVHDVKNTRNTRAVIDALQIV